VQAIPHAVRANPATAIPATLSQAADRSGLEGRVLRCFPRFLDREVSLVFALLGPLGDTPSPRNKTSVPLCKATKGTNTKATSSKGHFRVDAGSAAPPRAAPEAPSAPEHREGFCSAATVASGEGWGCLSAVTFVWGDPSSDTNCRARVSADMANHVANHDGPRREEQV